jgi:hypothetical protein
MKTLNLVKNTKLLTVLLIALLGGALGGCTDASVASSNLSKAADMFELERRIVFYNGINGEYILTIEGKCSVANSGNQLAVTCKVGSSEFKKHYLGLSDNVTYFSEQVDSASVSVYNYRVIFKPEAIVPNIDLETSR